MAAITFVPDTIKDPVRAHAVNATGTLNLLEAARRSRTLERFVFLSTGQVYGRPHSLPIGEDHPLEPTTPYAATKLAADRLVQAYHHTYGLRTTIVRPFNVYGPGQTLPFIVPTIMEQVRAGNAPLLGDLRPIRDFTYIDDFIDLLLRASSRTAAVGQVFNSGTGVSYSVAQIARKIMRLAGVNGRPQSDPSRYRAGEIEKFVVDSRKAQQLLDWKPKVNIDEGLRRTWAASSRPSPS